MQDRRCPAATPKLDFGGGTRYVRVTVRRGTQVVRERSAKPLCVGSIPTRASIVPCIILRSGSLKVEWHCRHCSIHLWSAPPGLSAWLSDGSCGSRGRYQPCPASNPGCTDCATLLQCWRRFDRSAVSWRLQKSGRQFPLKSAPEPSCHWEGIAGDIPWDRLDPCRLRRAGPFPP